ncbi:hypothetical protein UFOVP43_12 [uncultured Caudovirales phage]|uniref:Intramolecular chaperone auto-processing domain containing protein n=1 Tax=uncultured Caudovirales phage TaxID=2100421 RepID=A0A6J5KNM1_9CAUD|nr:hypothetical protein UFOVP43_12 [uncultured Caudovirales phage]
MATQLSQLSPELLAQFAQQGIGSDVLSSYGADNPFQGATTWSPTQINGYQAITQPIYANQGMADNPDQTVTGHELSGYATSADGNIYSYDTSGKLTGVTKQDSGNGMLGSLVGMGLSMAFPEFAPLIMGGTSLAQGGSLTDALKAGLLTYGGQQLMGAMGNNTPSDIGVSQTQAPLDSSFDQYLSPQGATSYPVSPGYTPADYSLGSTPVDGMGGAQGIQANPNANLADMGGGQGLTNATSANLAGMGGGQGITGLASGGGTIGATGVNTGGSVLGTNAATGQTLGTALNNINTGITNPSISTTGGLDLTNNLTGGTLGAGATSVTGATTGATGATVGAGATGATAATGAAGGTGALGTGLTAAQLATLGTGVAGALTGANTNSAISNAQAIQNAAAAKSAGTLGDIYNTQMGSLAPYQATGQAGLTGINANMPYFQHQFDTADLNSNLAPNYAFQLGQGQQANQRAANVGGGALSGNTLTGLNRYTQDYAGNAYQQAFNNYNNQRNNIYNTLSGIAGIGGTANSQAIGAGNTYGTNLTNLNTGLAAAQAGATVGQAQNTSNTISNLGNAATLAALLGQKNTVGQ